ncbi:hypothetical protein ACHAXR_010592, partial [Thalassiosira sp. AJA248-18]
MYEWTLGIADNDPTTWKSLEPLWDDEKITATSSHSFHDVMNKLCETAIKNRREYDHAIHEHLWNMKIISMEDAMNPWAAEERLMDDDSDEDMSSDGSDDEDEKKYTGNIIIQCPDEEMRGGYEDFDDPEAHVLGSKTKLSNSLLPQGKVIKVTYDYGTTTMLYLKVLSVKAKAVQSLLQYFSLEADSATNIEDLKAVPAYQLPKEKQVDSYFPFASKAFLGYYVPIFTGENDGSDAGQNRKVMGSLTLGLSAKLRSEEDIVFCTMEDRTQSRDILFCPGAIEPNELIQVIDKAWEPRDKSADTDGLDRYRYDWINRWVVAADNDEEYERISDMFESDSGYGSKNLLFRLARDRKRSGFEFEKAFPKTYAMLRCGKFRWFQYKKGVLRVIVGRGVGHDSRQCESKQILRTWNHEFKSFHEILCAVEASWVWKGQELKANAVLPEFDTDLGPSRALPKEPPSLGKEKDAIMISACSDKKKLVTSLAISEELDGKTVLYSGHDDGTLTKWSLDNNEQIWTKKIYADGTKDFQRYLGGCGLIVKDTPGVAGIVVRPDPNSKSKTSIVYTWTDAYDGYPQSKFDDRGPSCLKAWSGADGKYKHQYVCDVGCDEEGASAYPSISTVVFCKVYYEDIGASLDSIVVGLHCCCNTLEYDESYSEFDLEEAQEFSHGNIVPFLEHSPGREMPSWRGQGGVIRAMAVAGSKYLVSFSIRPGHGLPDSMVLWSLEQAGIPLFRKGFWDHHQRNRLKQQQTRLDDIAGISIEENEILLADNNGDRIASATIEEEESGNPFLKLHGYANIGSRYYEGEGFHGRMASQSKYAVVAMEISPTAWIFPIKGCSTHSSLDRRDGNQRKFDDDFTRGEEDHECLKEKRAGRGIAVGKVEFPLWGGNKPLRKKKRQFGSMEFDDDSDGLGGGGPVQLAMRGSQVVAGFSNGTLAKFVLSKQFEESQSSTSSN